MRGVTGSSAERAALSIPMTAFFAPTLMEVTTDPKQLMREMETWFVEALGAHILKRKAFSMKVWVAHPDGFDVTLKAKHNTLPERDGVLEFTRRSGDWVLCTLVHRMFSDFYNAGCGSAPPAFYPGQMLQPVSLTPSPPPFEDVPALRLDGGLKRKVDAIDEVHV